MLDSLVSTSPWFGLHMCSDMFYVWHLFLNPGLCFLGSARFVFCWDFVTQLFCVKEALNWMIEKLYESDGYCLLLTNLGLLL